ncbi:cytochrome c-type biogenesis protein CcmH [Deltaproteobacteria bacterium TL4]
MQGIKIISISVLLFVSMMSFCSADEELERKVRELGDELRCPTCQGLSVHESESGFSTQMKIKIREMLQQGKTDEEIKAYFVESYGEWILRAPSKTGFNLLLWVLPGLLILVALFLLWKKSNSWVKANPDREELSPLSPEEQQLLKKDQNQFENS